MDSRQFMKCLSILAYSGVIVYNIEVSSLSIIPLGISEKAVIFITMQEFDNE